MPRKVSLPFCLFDPNSHLAKLKTRKSRTLRISKMLTHAGTEKSEDDAADVSNMGKSTTWAWLTWRRWGGSPWIRRGLTFRPLMAPPCSCHRYWRLPAMCMLQIKAPTLPIYGMSAFNSPNLWQEFWSLMTTGVQKLFLYNKTSVGHKRMTRQCWSKSPHEAVTCYIPWWAKWLALRVLWTLLLLFL